jgi:hypothetical protein
MAAQYAAYPAYRRQFATMGIDPADAAAITRAVMLLDPGTASEDLDAYRSAGADMPVVYPVVPQGAPDGEAARSTLMAVAPNLP